MKAHAGIEAGYTGRAGDMSGCGKICAVIVTWNIGEEFIVNVNAVLHQVDRVIIIDNGSCTKTRLMLESIWKQNSHKIDIILNDKNAGIASAQNQGVKRACEMEFKWILLLDHDSRPEPDMVVRLLEGYDSLKKNDKEVTGLVAPYIREQKIDREMKFVVSQGFFIKLRKFGEDRIMRNVQVVISSGSMIRKELFESIGVFKQDLFIDYVDTEFCLRMAKFKWKIILVRDAVLNHSTGELSGRRLAGRTTGVTNHSPLRRFTIFRNRIKVWKCYFHTAPSYIAFDIAMGFYDLIKIILFETSRKKKLRAVFKGIAAGALG